MIPYMAEFLDIVGISKNYDRSRFAEHHHVQL